MRRISALLVLGIGLAAPALAQDSTRVALAVSVSPDSTLQGAREPLVRTMHLFDDERWLSMLQSGFPVRLHYRVELWRGRSGWFDASNRVVEWDVVVQHEPLLDQYTVTRITGHQRRENRYATFAALAASLGSSYRVVTLTPTDPGAYYYAASLQVTTLSDSDMDELERFFRGDVSPAAGGKENVGSAVGRGAKRLVLRLAGLPSLKLEEKSEKFEVR
jgi:hypothetical protein